MNAPRSGCPINLTLEALGDRWSLIVIRDLMFGNRRHCRELLSGRLCHPDVLSRKHMTEIYLSALEADAAALRDGERPVMERVREVLQAAIDAR